MIWQWAIVLAAIIAVCLCMRRMFGRNGYCDQIVDLRRQLGATQRDLYLARKDVDTHKDRDGIEDRVSASVDVRESTAWPYVVSFDQKDGDAPKGTMYAIRSIDKSGSFRYLAKPRNNPPGPWTPDLSRARLWEFVVDVMLCVDLINHDLAVVAIPPGYVDVTP